MRIGIYFGCFIPLHEGHISVLKKALSENDHVILGICGFDDDRGKDFIPFRDRIKLIKKIYGKNKKITLVVIDDKKIGLVGAFDQESWDAWCEELFMNSGFNPNKNHYTWYMGEPNYVKQIKRLFQNHEFVLADRNLMPISGTMIRENPKMYQNYINSIYVNYLQGVGKL